MIPEWLEIAFKETGVCEFPGNKSNPRISEYLLSVPVNKLSFDSIPWCSAFIYWVLKQNDIVGKGSLLARKWLHWGLKLDTPLLGCVTILSSPYRVWGGHIGFFITQTKESVLLLSGNCNNSVKFKLYPVDLVLGHRWPSHISFIDPSVKI